MISRRMSLTIGTCCLLGVATAAYAGILEPSTVLYGRVVNPSSGQPFLVTEGTLSWTITVPGLPNVVLNTQLEDLADGAYSYRLDVPHEALSLGTVVDLRTVPLSFREVVFHHSSVQVNGRPARIAVADAEAFAASQATRAFTHRVDLIVDAPLPDTDGDGMPDWWEDLNGLDKQLDDALMDTDGDGRSNLSEFVVGTSPVMNNSVPVLMTTVITVCGQGKTGIRLTALDTDTPPAELTYTITQLPTIGSLCLRTAAEATSTWGTALASGGVFTQQDIDEGRLVYVHNTSGTEETSFSVSLRDATPEHTAFPSTVTIDVRRPSVSSELANMLDSFSGVHGDILEATHALPPQGARDLSSYLLSKWLGVIVWDVSNSETSVVLRTPSSDMDAVDYAQDVASGKARDSSHVLVGGFGDDVLTGGMEDDIIDGGPGDDMLRGNGGNDTFVFRSAQDGNDTIWDFDADADRIDISALLAGASTDLADHVNMTSSGDDVVLGIDVDGDGNGYSDLTITLIGVADAAGSNDLYALTDSGKLDSGGLELPSRLSVSSARNASESGPTAGVFVLTRGGSLKAALTVNVTMNGSAINGVDYARIPGQVTFPEGQRTCEVLVSPYADMQVEGTETVEISVLPGDDYGLNSSTSASLVIQDPGERIGLTTVEPAALLSPQTSGLLLLTRSSSPSWTTNVLLQVSGTATNGVDYEYIAPVVTLTAWQSSATILVVPKVGAVLVDGAETVTVKLLPDPAGNYTIDGGGSASVTIVADSDLLQEWRNTNDPDNPHADPDHDGLTNAVEETMGSDPYRCTVVLAQGWNLISTPRVPAQGQTVREQLGDAYIGSVWTWSETGYQVLPQESPMVPGMAYFVLCLAPTHVDLPDTVEGNGHRDVNAGWNLVGPVRGGAQGAQSLAGMTVFGFSGDDAYGFISPEDLKPTKGYWLYAPEDGAVDLP